MLRFAEGQAERCRRGFPESAAWKGDKRENANAAIKAIVRLPPNARPDTRNVTAPSECVVAMMKWYADPELKPSAFDPSATV
jgi:hypothetical protein